MTKKWYSGSYARWVLYDSGSGTAGLLKNVLRICVDFLERLAQRGVRRDAEVVRDLQLHLSPLVAQLLRKIGDGDRQRDLARVLLDDVSDLLDRLLGHSRVRHLESDLADFLVADALELDDL